MRRPLLLAALLAGMACPAAAYTLRFSPDPVPAGALVTVTLDYYDPYGCSPRLEKIQGPAGVIRLAFSSGDCAGESPPLGPDRSVSHVLGRFAEGTYTIEVVNHRVWPRPVAFASATLHVHPIPLCIPDVGRLCLNDGRFQVDVVWRDFAGNSGPGTPVPLDAGDSAGPDTGFFWFFAPDNLELMVKVLDACILGGRFWVFLSPASTVAIDVEVTDMKTLATRHYSQALGGTPGLTADTDAFPCF